MIKFKLAKTFKTYKKKKSKSEERAINFIETKISSI